MTVRVVIASKGNIKDMYFTNIFSTYFQTQRRNSNCNTMEEPYFINRPNKSSILELNTRTVVEFFEILMVVFIFDAG